MVRLSDTYITIFSGIVLVCILSVLLQLSASSLTEASTSYSSYIESKSTSGDYLAARFAYHNGDIEKSSLHYEAALSTLPNDETLLRASIRTNILSNNMEKAIHLSKRLLAVKQTSIEARLFVVLEKIKQNDFSEAYKIAKTSNNDEIESFNSTTTNLFLPIMMWSMAGQKNYPEAFLLLEEMEKDSFMQPFILYSKAILNDLSGNTEKAEMLFDKLLSKEKPSILEKQTAAKFYYRIGKKEKALSSMKNVDEKSTQNSAIGDRNNSTSQQEALLQLSYIFQELAINLYSRNFIEQSMMYLRISLFLNSELYTSKVLLATLFERTNNFAKAIAIYKQIPKYFWLHNTIQIAIAVNYIKMGDFDKATKMLKEFSQINIKDTESLFILGDMFLSEEKFDKAIDSYSIAIERVGEISPSHWSVFYARGTCYEQSGQWNKAEADLKKSLELSPNQPDVINYLAYSWIMEGKNLDEAEKMLKKAVENRPTDAHILDSYGWALFKLGKYEKAVEFIEKANIIMPYDTTINDHLGDIYQNIGRLNESRFQWKRALWFNPKEAEAKKIKHKLENYIAGHNDITPVVMIKSSADQSPDVTSN